MVAAAAESVYRYSSQRICPHSHRRRHYPWPALCDGLPPDVVPWLSSSCPHQLCSLQQESPRQGQVTPDHKRKVQNKRKKLAALATAFNLELPSPELNAYLHVVVISVFRILMFPSQVWDRYHGSAADTLFVFWQPFDPCLIYQTQWGHNSTHKLLVLTC